jgi:hypothetical protein
MTDSDPSETWAAQDFRIAIISCRTNVYYRVSRKDGKREVHLDTLFRLDDHAPAG